MSWSVLLLSLHTAAEFFLVGVERLSRLEQVKTRKREIAVAVISGGRMSSGLMLAACGMLLPIRRCLCVGSLLRHLYGNVGVENRHIGCRLRVVETLVECICRELLAESGTVQYRHGVVVYERNTVYAPLVGVTEYNIYAAGFQLGCEILLIGSAGKHIGNSVPCRCDINLVFGSLEASLHGGTACEFSEARSLERIGDNFAFVVCGEIHQTVILAPVHSAVGLLTPYII